MAAGGFASGEYSLSAVMTIVSRLVTGPQRRDRRRQPIERQQHPDARVAHEVLDLRRRVGGIDVDDDGAEPQHGEHADHVLRTVRQHDADAIAFDDAVTRQRGGKSIGLVLELAEGQVGAEKCRAPASSPPSAAARRRISYSGRRG